MSRDYLTPEDIEAARQAGGNFLVVTRALLEAVEAKAVEDSSLCAFNVLHMLEWR